LSRSVRRANCAASLHAYRAALPLSDDRQFFEEVTALISGFVPDQMVEASRRLKARHKNSPYQHASAVLSLACVLDFISSPWADNEQGVPNDVYNAMRIQYEAKLVGLASALANGEAVDIKRAADEVASERLK
jgi:hypothetical protein